jgi:uncharacterized protein (DUF58 family)
VNAVAAPLPISALRRVEWRARRLASALLRGEHRSAFRGRGLDFDQVVPYAWGDDVRDIDWNATARLGEAYRKRYVEERELTVVLLFEDSLSLQFGSGERTKREVLVEMAQLLTFVAAETRDRLGTWHASPRGQHIREPRRGRGNLLRLAGELAAQPAPDLRCAAAPEIDWTLLASSLPRGSVVVWLGDFPPRPAPAGWPALARRFELVGVRVDDPFERELPRLGLLPAADPLSGEVVPLDTESEAARARHRAWRDAREDAWRALFPQPHSRLCFSTGDDPTRRLLAFFEARMRSFGR